MGLRWASSITDGESNAPKYSVFKEKISAGFLNTGTPQLENSQRVLILLQNEVALHLSSQQNRFNITFLQIFLLPIHFFWSFFCGKGVPKLRKQTTTEFLLRISGFKASNVSGFTVIIHSESSWNKLDPTLTQPFNSLSVRRLSLTSLEFWWKATHN